MVFQTDQSEKVYIRRNRLLCFLGWGFWSYRQVWCRYRHRGVGDTLIVGEKKVGWIVMDQLTSPDGWIDNQSQLILHYSINNSTQKEINLRKVIIWFRQFQ